MDHPAILATIPRSGTWWSHFVFHFYVALAAGREPAVEGVARYPKRVGNTWPFLIGHRACPGHESLDLGPAWSPDQLVNADLYFEQAAVDLAVDFSPFSNSSVRLCLLCRNPLDRAISNFQHRAGLIAVQEGKLPNPSSIKEPSAWIGTTNRMLATLKTWHAVAQLCPEQVILCRYEDLCRNPVATFCAIARHLLGEVDEVAMARAVELTTTDRMRQYEKDQGMPFAGNTYVDDTSHIHDNPIGGWRGVFGDAEFNIVAEKCKSLGIPLDLFDFGS